MRATIAAWRTTAAALPLMLAPWPAVAQTVPSQAPQAQPGEQEGLSDIVVTAQKRAENLQRVPLAITAVSEERLAATGVNNLQELTTVVPGLATRSVSGSFQPAIRGIGTSSSVVENPVALFIDGVYLPQQREGLRELNDVAQVAVLKGPQGTLFGRNATGGVIQITTKQPSHDFSGRIGAEIDQYALFKSDVYLTGGLSRTLAGSFSGQFATQGNGWGTNLTTGHDTFRLNHQISLRGKLLFQPGPATQITLIADYLDRSALQNSYQNYPGTQLSFVTLPQPRSKYNSYAGRDSFQAFIGGGASLTVEQDLDFAHLLSITSYRRGKGRYGFDNTGAPGSYFYVQSPNSPNEDYTQEIQLISRRSQFNWVIGAFYFHNANGAQPIQRTITGPLAPLPTSVTVNTTAGTEWTESVAPFGQADWEFVPGTTLTVGVRYTYEKRTVDSTGTLQRVAAPTITQTRSESTTIHKPTFRVALSHDFTSDIHGYLSFNTGIKSGGYNVINPANPAYLPEKLTSYEAGLKTQLLDRRLRFNVAGFYYDYSNVQIIQFLSGIQTIVNGAAAKLYGVDVDFEAELARGLRLSGGLEAEHSEFTNYKNAVFSTPKPAGGATLFAGDATGHRLPLSQQLSANASLDYHSDLRSGSIDANVTANYNGDYFFEPDNFLRQSPFVYLNSSLKYTFPNEKVSLMLWAKNILNEVVLTQPTTQAFGYPATYGSPPRTVGVTARVSF